MDILAYDPFFTARAADSAGVSLVDLEEVFAQADWISLHVPALPETRHLINADRLQKMKKGEKSQVVCPSAVAYGDRGSPPDIPPGATLSFEVELLDFHKP